MSTTMDWTAPIELESLSTRMLPTELEEAAFIQRSLPQTKFAGAEGFSVASFCRSAHTISGDFFEVSQAGDGLCWLAIADVMGKGVPAALLATGLGPLLRSLKEQSRGPGELLAKLNRLLFPELSEVDTFITAQIVLADLRRRELRVAGAGHCPLLVVEPDAGTQQVKSTGLPLGVEPDGIFPEVRARFESRAGVLLYTDGVTEAQDEDGSRFGQEQLEALIFRAVQQSMTADEIKDALVTELDAFRGSAPVSDDQTFVVLTEANALDIARRPSEALCLAS